MAEQTEAHHEAFPTLDAEQIAALAKCTAATPVRYPDGHVLFKAGDRNFPFYVVRSGEIEILDESGDEPRTVVVHGAGQFSGDVSHLTGNPAVVSAVVRGGFEGLAVSPSGLEHVLSQCPTMADIILNAFITRRHLLRESGFTGLRVIGSRYSRETFRVRDFLARNHVLFTWFDLESDEDVGRLLRQFGLSEADTPVVACGRKALLRNPSNAQLAEALGLHRSPEKAIYDLVVVGAGPAGLAAAVYGASEGLSTFVVERTAPGGQAGASMRIENYLGFPTGITGSELADRAVLQASRFGARLPVGSAVANLAFDKAYPILTLEGGETITAKCLLIATGAQYRRLLDEGCERFEGCGVYYAATPIEVPLCSGGDAVVVGAGNSAGQAAVFLAGHLPRVYVVVRSGDLYASMSSYLAQRIEQTPNIEVLYHTVVRRMEGNGYLTSVVVADRRTSVEREIATRALFSFIGAVPRIEWLPPEIERDAKSFVQTGLTLAGSPSWTKRRSPFLLETSRPGVFAAGDVRAGSVKRVASAVGEGAMAVQFVHEYLSEM